VLVATSHFHCGEQLLIISNEFLSLAALGSLDDNNADTPAVTSAVSTVGEVTSSDTTAIPSQPSAASQDKVCVC